MKSPITELIGTFGQVRWSKPDNTWLIAILEDGTSIVGSASPELFIRGVEYTFSGRWEDNDSYGPQFKFETFVARAPVTDGAVMSYLQRFLFGSGYQFGAVKARKVLAEVGPERCLATLKSEPAKVAELTGITKPQAEAVAKILIEIERFEETRMRLVQLFQGRGFSQDCIENCINDFGVLAYERIKRDPFTMLVRRYASVGFLRCDQLYRDLGLPEWKLKRQTICLWHQIQEASGSVWIGAKEAAEELSRLVSSKTNPRKAIQLGVRAKWLSRKKDADGKLWLAERQDAIAESLIAKYALEIRNAHDSINGEPRKSENSSESILL